MRNTAGTFKKKIIITRVPQNAGKRVAYATSVYLQYKISSSLLHQFIDFFFFVFFLLAEFNSFDT